jgi:uncharacterized membrane protein YdjX (TVP38/TMEM64 family)
MARPSHRHVLLFFWIILVATALYFYIFQSEFIRQQFIRLQDLPMIWRYVIYIVLGCVRGFVLIPVTYLIILGLLILPVTPAYIFTMVGVMVSSTIIYYFSEYIGLGNFFKRVYPKQVAKITSTLKKRELPIIITWAFLPITPTDVMCYVCGILGVDFKKFFFGVLIGEGISCAIYVYVGKELLLFLAHSVFGA